MISLFCNLDTVCPDYGVHYLNIHNVFLIAFKFKGGD